MSLSLRDKQDFYDHLGKMLRAGIPITPAIEKLAATSRGSTGAYLRSLRRQIEAGATLGEAFQQARPRLSEMETATLAGLARAGQMESGLHQLSAYFGAMARARARVKRALAYPLFQLNLAILITNAPLVVRESFEAYLRTTGKTLAIFYGAAVVVAVLIVLLRDAADFVPAIDGLLRSVPFVGKVRRSFAVSRFCATYNMQLDAGVSVVESLGAASRASRSGLIRAAVQRALPEVRRGEQVGPQLARSGGALPGGLLQAIMVAEETGQLDRTLKTQAEEYQQDGFTRLETATEWIPRLIYFGVLLYVGWLIIDGYKAYMGQLDSVLQMQDIH